MTTSPSAPTRRRRLRPWAISLGVFVSLVGAGSAFVIQHPQIVDAARLLQQVLTLSSQQYVDSLPADSVYHMAARGLVRELNDRYTQFMSPRELQTFRQSMTGNYAGVGMGTGSNEDGRGLVVMQVFAGSPADRAGVLEGDVVVGVDTISAATLQKLTTDEISSRILGAIGTPVTLRFKREGIAEPVSLTMTRAEVHFPVVPYTELLPGGVGYVPLRMFTENAAEDVHDAIKRLKAQGATKVVLDLRDNGGGVRDQAVWLASIFLPPNLVAMRVRQRNAKEEILRTIVVADSEPTMPVVILQNENSASASEVFTGAMQDHDRALVVGTTSFGKGLVQQLYTLDDGFGLKMTTQRWLTPVGRSIQKERTLLPDGRYVEVHPDSLETDSARRARPMFTTDSGRTILGGGGITPDVVIPMVGETPAALAFAKAVNPVSGKFKSVLSVYASTFRGKVTPAFTVTPTMRAEFVRRLKASGITVDAAVVAKAGPAIDRLLGARIAGLCFGDSVAKRKYLKSDAPLTTAVALLSKSATQPQLFAAGAAYRVANAAKPVGASVGALR